MPAASALSLSGAELQYLLNYIRHLCRVRLFSSAEINRLALPAILGGIAEPLITLADTAFVGHLSTVALAAVGIAGGFYTMCLWILAQSLTAISAIVGRAYGSNTLPEVQSLVPQAMLANVFLGALFFAGTAYYASALFAWYGAEGDLLAACTAYYAIRGWGYPFSLLTLLLFGVFRGLQNTTWAMWISIGGASINIILDPLLIYGFEPFWGGYGLIGAAAASLVAQVAMTLTACLILVLKTGFHMHISRKLSPLFKQLSRMSGDLMLRTLALNLTFFLAFRLATDQGPAVVAAHAIALNIWLFSSFFIDGYAHAGNAIAGKLAGQNTTGAIFQLGKSICKSSLLIAAALACCYAWLYPWLGGWFTDDLQVQQLFQNIFWLVIASQPINAVAFALDGIYKGLGQTAFLRNLLLVATLLGFLPAALLSYCCVSGLWPIWLAFLLWMLVRAGGLWWHFKKHYAAHG